MVIETKEHRTPPLHVLKTLKRAGRSSDEIWPAYNSPIETYQRFFRYALRGRQITDIVAGYEEPVVIDLMSPSGTLLDLFTNVSPVKGFGIAVTLDELRAPEVQAIDSRMGIQQISGDLLQSKTWKRLSEALGPRKANLILERPLGGMEYVPDHGGFFAVALQRMWNMLATGGMLLLQVPAVINFRQNRVSVEDWVNLLQKNRIEATYDEIYSCMCIERASGAPEQLPFTKSVLVPKSDYVPGLEKSNYPSRRVVYFPRPFSILLPNRKKLAEEIRGELDPLIAKKPLGSVND